MTSIPTPVRHEIAQSRAFAAVCTCGHTEYSIIRLGALTYLLIHIDEQSTEVSK